MDGIQNMKGILKAALPSITTAFTSVPPSTKYVSQLLAFSWSLWLSLREEFEEFF